MKKFTLISLFLIFTVSIFSQKNKNLLKNEMDSISYAYGFSLFQQGLQQHLAQLNVITDTASISSKYNDLIDAEPNLVKKGELRKKMNAELEAANKTNSKNIAELLKGISSVIDNPNPNTAYNHGIGIGNQITNMFEMVKEEILDSNKGEHINKNLFLLGLTNALKKEDQAISDPSTFFNNKIEEKRLTKQMEKDKQSEIEYAGKIEENNRFFEENKNKPGVITLPSGLQYEIITEGTGEIPTENDRVKVHYTGTFLDGKVFDSSVERGSPAVFGVTQVIKGWTEALQLMPVGSKWKLYIPYDLAYGTQDRGSIPPYSTLVFEVELLGIE